MAASVQFSMTADTCRCGLGDRDISSAHVFGDEPIFACPVAHCVVAGGVCLGSDSDSSTSAGGTCRSLEELMEKGRCPASPASRRESGRADVDVVPVGEGTGREVSLLVDEASPGSSDFLPGQ